MFRIKSSSGMSVIAATAQEALTIHQIFSDDGDTDVHIVDAINQPVPLEVLRSSLDADGAAGR